MTETFKAPITQESLDFIQGFDSTLHIIKRMLAFCEYQLDINSLVDVETKEDDSVANICITCNPNTTLQLHEMRKRLSRKKSLFFTNEKTIAFAIASFKKVYEDENHPLHSDLQWVLKREI